LDSNNAALTFALPFKKWMYKKSSLSKKMRHKGLRFEILSSSRSL